MVTYHEYSKDLRALASILHEGNLPLPRYPKQGLAIDVHVGSVDDVEQAARTLGLKVVRRNGHTTVATHIGTVTLGFVHVDDAAMAEYNARQAYARTMPDPDPAPWAARDLAHLAAGPDPLVVT